MVPIYRAKKIDSDEYVEGFYFKDLGDDSNGFHSKEYHFILDGLTSYSSDSWSPLNEQIDPSTLAIHFPDMIDSEGTKIFASLSEDGRGGDILEYASVKMGVARYNNNQIMVGEVPLDTLKVISRSAKVTGIQQ